MLLELTIGNFAIVDHLQISFSHGFNALTGETGAGKSIVIDAVGALLGEKLGAEYVRSGSDQARVEGIFALPQERELTYGALLSTLEEYGLDNGEGTLILSREINASGRSVSRVNGRAVPVAVLQQIGASLIDIHGQSEHLSLLRVSQHVDLLDEYAGLGDLRAQIVAKVAALRQIRRELQALLRDERELARRTDLLRFQANEINAASLRIGEEDELEAERRILANAETLSALADGAYKHLYDGLEDQRSVSDLLGDVSLKLGDIVRLDPSLQDEAAVCEGALYQIEELARSLRAYRDGIEYDPERLLEIEERIDLIRTLKRKYGSTIEEVLRFGEEAAAELEMLGHSEERVAELQDQEGSLLREIAVLGEEISAARKKAGEALAKAMEAELADLNMPKARFMISMERTEAVDGVTLSDGKTYAFDGSGVDKVEFLISPNPGEPLKPLAKIASGGETARLMLALKTILSKADPVPTLIFDEIDQGIGGRSGQIVGKKLWNLTGRHQVICVTHLPQIACFGDSHFSVAKRVVDERTTTTVRTLSREDRVEEIMAMLGSVSGSEVARRNAEEILLEADLWKYKSGPNVSNTRLEAEC